MKKRILAALLAVVMLFGLVACSKPAASVPVSQEDAEATKPVVEAEVVEKEVSKAEEGEALNYKKDIIISISQANVSVGPQDVNSGTQRVMGLMQFNRLTVFDPTTKELVGELAEKFESAESGKVWTFYLKQGILFQNGEELKADDCVYTWERAKEFGKNTAAWAGTIEKCEALDDYTVRYTLSAPNMDFGFAMSDFNSSILNRKANEEDPENGYAIGTNGWKIKEFVANDYVTYERFDDSFVWQEEGMNPTETITIKYMADQNARMIGVQAGDLDLGWGANNAEYYNYEEMEGVEPVVAASWSCDYVGMNANCEYFKDENVRKAVAYAINKDEALEIICNGFGLTCKSFWCPDAIGYTENFTENYSYNLEKAKEYMAKSAYPDGFSCTLTTISGYSLYAETVQSQLAAIGIDCQVELTDSPGMNAGGQAGDFEMYIWNSTMSPYGNYLNQVLTTGGVNNFAHFSNEKIDQLMVEALAEADTAKRAQLYEQVQEEINNDCYLVPMFFGYLSYLTQENLEGYRFTPTGNFMYNVRAIVE